MLRINAAFFKCFHFPLTLFRSAQTIAELLRKESAGISSIPRLSACVRPSAILNWLKPDG
jgi:hypothetical protein